MERIKHYMWRTSPEVAITKFIEKNVAISVSDEVGRIIYANNRFCTIIGSEERELIGVNNSLFKTNMSREPFYKNLWETIEKGNIWKGVLSNKTNKGNLFWLETTIVPLKDDEGNVESFIAMYLDVTKAKIDSKKIEIQNQNTHTLGDTA
ncbi:PAS domain-containing protein [Mariniflexile litorale]|uniref:PAS domain-containing protein n=1 Tax=Mariniflexile litorale TaxID=3045158 RepID=A0AAU7ELP6_9FLAO|nr:PAS domain-containing protein [Mariniflexile sp. KMM 9835]MDQ8212777.1 PAS domain-containing protein [Mariniflexile sp. KMM 9835]